MRILAVSHPCVTDVNQQFYAELEALGHDVQLIVPENFRHEYAVGAVQVVRWPTFRGNIVQRRIGLSSSIPLHFYVGSLRPVMKKFDPDVLYVEEEPYSVSAWQAFYASRGLGMKRVIYSAQNIDKRYPPPFPWLEQYVLRQADMAAVVSPEVERVVKLKGFSGRILPFPLGVDTSQFQPSEHQRSSMRAQHGFGNDFIVGYVGRLVPEKGIQTLLDIVPTLENLHARLLVVGTGPMLSDVERVKQLFPRHLHLQSTVVHRDIHRWMNAMDVLVLPSQTTLTWKEQFGRVIIEALACKVPVIGSDSGEIPVLLRETQGGWVFPEKNVAKLKQVLYHVLNNEHERSLKARDGYQSVLKKYSKRALAQSFIEEVAPR